jgi:hypothetical protein
VAVAPKRAAAEPCIDSHLLQLIEKQPSCLLRVGRDGLLLACNDAGLGLLGKTELAQVLNRGFEEQIAADHAGAWREFVDRVWASGAGSLECDLSLVLDDSAKRTVVFQAIALRNHPDGLESLLVSVRDTSPLRRLEASLRSDRAVQEQLAITESRLEAALCERQEFAVQLDALRVDQARLTASLQQRQTEHDAERAHAAEDRRLLEIARQESQVVAVRLADAEARLHAAAQEQGQLLAQLEALRAEQQQLIAALQQRDAEREAERQRASHERRQLEAALHERDAASRREAEERRELEARLQNGQATVGQELADARAKLEAALHEQERLTAALDARVADYDRVIAERQQLETSLRDRDAERERAAEERRQLEASLQDGHAAATEKLREAEHQLDAARQHEQQLGAQLDEARAEQQRLTTALDARAADHDRVAAESERLTAAVRQLEAERARAADAQRQLVEEHRQLEASLRDRTAVGSQLAETEARLADLQRAQQQLARELDDARGERDRLAARLEESRVDHDRLTAALEQGEADRRREREALEADVARVRQRGAELDAALTARDRETRERVAALEGKLAAAVAEQSGLQRLLDEHRATGDEAAAAAEQRRQHVAELQDRIDGLVAEQTRLAGLVDELQHARRQMEAERDTAGAAHAAAQTMLEHALAERHAAAAEQARRDRQAIEALTARHAEATAAAERTTTLVAELRRLAEDHDAARAHVERALAAARADAASQHDHDRRRLEEAEARYASALAEQQRLLQVVEHDTATRQKLEADHAAARAAREQQLALDYERAMAVRDRERTELVANLQAELALAMADQRRLQMLLTRAEAEQSRLVAAHTADRVESDRSLGEALFKKNQIAKSLADQRVELDRWRDTAQDLESLAAAGRLAMHVAHELHEMVATLDDRARFLLSIAALEASYRPEVERLRAEAMRAASLARQLVAIDRDGQAATAANAPVPVLAPVAQPDRSETH